MEESIILHQTLTGRLNLRTTFMNQHFINELDKIGLQLIKITAGGIFTRGFIDAGGSVLMIAHMEKTSRIEKTEHYNIYRMGKLATTQKGEEWSNMR